jgi:phospholipid-binding lipoprotein MlaA
MRRRARALRSVLPVLAVLCVGSAVATGCASKYAGNPADPWAPFNRPVFQFNDSLDRHVLRPVAVGWTHITFEAMRDSIAKFFYNAAFPSRLVSNLGQGDLLQAANEVGRFAINTTVGLAGFFDPATRIGLSRRDEDAGQMFAIWGIPSGPYWVIPFLGPSTPRDAAGMAVDALLDPIAWIEFAFSIPTFGGPTVLNVVNARARADKRIEQAREAALDFYVFVRDAYEQRRAAEIANHASLSDYGSGAIYENTGPSDQLYEVPEGEGGSNAPKP